MLIDRLLLLRCWENVLAGDEAISWQIVQQAEDHHYDYYDWPCLVLVQSNQGTQYWQLSNEQRWVTVFRIVHFSAKRGRHSGTKVFVNVKYWQDSTLTNGFNPKMVAAPKPFNSVWSFEIIELRQSGGSSEDCSGSFDNYKKVNTSYPVLLPQCIACYFFILKPLNPRLLRLRLWVTSLVKLIVILQEYCLHISGTEHTTTLHHH